MRKFIIRGVSKKFKGLQKVKSYKPVEKKFTEQATLFRQEAASRFARGVETTSLESGMKKIRAISMKLFKDTKFYTKKPGTNFKIKTAQGKSTLKRIDKAKTQAFKTARSKGMRALQKKSDELGVGIRRFGNQKTKTIQRLSDDEARELGFPPREIFKSSKKTPMTNIDKTIDQYSRLEKFNPKTGKYQTFRTYNIRTKTGRVGRELTYLENKFRKK
tara:strand:+ start:350 stop:1000 length:651 start_codon:yes stop_codon:yes gene_type:complete